MEESQQMPILPYQAQEDTPSIEREPENSEERRFTKEEWVDILDKAWILKERDDKKQKESRLVKIAEEMGKRTPELSQEQETLPLSSVYKSAKGLGIDGQYIDKTLELLHPSKERLEKILKKYIVFPPKRALWEKHCTLINRIYKDYYHEISGSLGNFFKFKINTSCSSDDFGYFISRIKFNFYEEKEIEYSKLLKFLKIFKNNNKRKLAVFKFSIGTGNDGGQGIHLDILTRQTILPILDPILSKLEQEYRDYFRGQTISLID